MHLLLALTGLDYFYPVNSAFQSDNVPADTYIYPSSGIPELYSPGQNSAAASQDMNIIHLHTITDHHQRGLECFREELSVLSASNCNQVFAGSMLLVGFAFASLRVRNMNDTRSNTEPAMPRLDWIYLIQGLTTVVKEHWTDLGMGPLRHMLQFVYATENWQMYPSEMFVSISTHQVQHCSQRKVRFSLGAYNACTGLKHFVDFQSQDATNSAELSQAALEQKD
jgi:hypothetical protein